MANFLIKLELAGEAANQDAGLQSMIDVSDLTMAMGQADSFANGHRKWGAKAKVKVLNETGLLASRLSKGSWTRAR